MYRLNQIKLNIYHSESDFRNKIARAAGVSVDNIEWTTLIILHKSIDARDKNNILFVYNVAFSFVTENEGKSTVNPRIQNAKTKLEKYEPIKFNPILFSNKNKEIDLISEVKNSQVRPIVVGLGPAGIFASYILALNGLKPIIVERGKPIDDRIKDVENFFDSMELDEESNVCFGEGGAGAFSDGKLNTNNKDKTGIYHFILETFVKFGADKRILYENLPHIGTDKLVDVIKNMRDDILKLGGEIYYNTKLTFKGGLAKLAPTGGGLVKFDTMGDDLNLNCNELCGHDNALEKVPIILAIGNSSRDTFRELIENGFDIQAKPIAVGYRIAHRQSFINESQYGGARETRPYEENSKSSLVYRSHELCEQKEIDSVYKKLGPASYKLTYDVGNGHSVYSFCMCPGGYIINSSNYKGKLSINGMSYNDRSGKYANSAIVETISPEDVLGLKRSTLQNTAIKMIEFQEMIEERAFELEKGFIPYVTSGSSDICIEEIFKGQAKYSEKLKTVFDDLGLKFNINDDIEKALQHFNKIIPGFFSGSHSSPIRMHELHEHSANLHYIIAGVETRTSSPVKLERDENFMCNVPNFYPCGEGLGHGGGIISCAADGVKVAMKLSEKLLKNCQN